MSPAREAARRITRLSATGILLALGVVYLVAGIHRNLVPVGPGLANRVGTRVGDDFSAFYAVAREVTRGRARAVYAEDALREAHARAIGAEAPRYQWAYPPTAGVLLAPLALLEPLAAYWTWTAAALAVALIALFRATRDAPVAALALVFPGVAHAMICNPTGLTHMALLAVAMAALGTRPALAGVATALLTYKPHLAWLPPLAFASAGRRRALAAWMLAALALPLVSLLAFGLGAWSDFLAAARLNVAHVDAGRLPLDRMPTPYAALLSNSAAPRVAAAGQVLVTAMAALAVVHLWRRSPRLGVSALALAAATPIATPYAYDYDMAMLAVPFVLLAAERRAGAAVPAWVLAALWVGPLLVPLVAQASGWHLGLPLLGALLAWAVHETAPSGSGGAATERLPQPRQTPRPGGSVPPARQSRGAPRLPA